MEKVGEFNVLEGMRQLQKLRAGGKGRQEIGRVNVLKTHIVYRNKLKYEPEHQRQHNNSAQLEKNPLFCCSNHIKKFFPDM